MGVVVYSTKSCPWCVKAKDYLDSLKVSYESIDVGSNRDAAREVVEKTRQQGVPVVKVEDNYIVGFDKGKIQSALQEAGLI
ncbi:MAG: NrdH-redoxin [Synergistaceae bacterium]|jgi:glutaredoxin-like YruB-family protein|nr:NrdH-redoxin [Synergistaceae bacterium]